MDPFSTPPSSNTSTRWVSSYNAACAVAYGAYRLAQVLIIPQKFPGAVRLENYLRGKLTDAAIEGAVGFTLNKITGKSSEDAIGDFIRNVQVGALNLGDNLLARQGGTLATHYLRHQLFGSFQDFNSAEAIEHAGKRIIDIGKLPFVLFSAYVIAFREEAWQQFDEILGIDKKLQDWHISSDKFWGGDTLRKAIKGLMRFLLDIFIVETNKEDALAGNYVQGVRDLRASAEGGLGIAEALGVNGLKNKAYFAMGGLALNQYVNFFGPGILRAGNAAAAWGTPEMKKWMTATNASYAIYSAASMTFSAVGLATSLMGAISLGTMGVGAAVATPLALLYMRKNYPDQWETLCQKMPSLQEGTQRFAHLLSQEELDMTLFDKGGSNDFDPHLDIMQLYGLEDHKLFEQSMALFQGGIQQSLVIASIQTEIASLEVELEAVKNQQNADPLLINKKINELEDLRKDLTSSQELLESILKEHSKLQDEHPSLKFISLRQELAAKEMEKLFVEQAKELAKNIPFEIEKALERASSLKKELELAREQASDLNDPISMRIVEIEAEMSQLHGQVMLLMQNFLDIAYDAENEEELRLKKDFEGKIEGLLRELEATALLDSSDKVKGVFIDSTLLLARMGALQGFSAQLNLERSLALEKRLESVSKDCKELDTHMKLAEAEYKKEIKIKAEAALKKLPVIGPDTKPIELVERLLTVATLFKERQSDVDDLNQSMQYLKKNIDQLKEQYPELAKQMEDNALTLHYNNIFALGNEARYNTTVELKEGSKELIVHVKATHLKVIVPPIAGELLHEVKNIKDLSFEAGKAIQDDILSHELYALPNTPNGLIDGRFMEQMSSLNIFVSAYNNLSLKDIYESEHDEEYTYLATQSHQQWTLSRLREQIPNEALLGRITQCIHKDILKKVETLSSNFIQGNNGDVFVPYNGNYLRVKDSKSPEYEFHIHPTPSGSVYLTVKVMWPIDAHASDPENKAHVLNSEDNNSFEAQFMFVFKPPQEFKQNGKLEWNEWFMSGLRQVVGIQENLNPAEYQPGPQNIKVEALPPAYIALVNDTLTARI